MRENMTFLTNYYQIREMTIDRMKEIIDQNKKAKEGGTVFFGDLFYLHSIPFHQQASN